MPIIIPNGGHVHTHSNPVFLVGVKLPPPPTHATSASRISAFAAAGCFPASEKTLREGKQNWSVANTAFRLYSRGSLARRGEYLLLAQWHWQKCVSEGSGGVKTLFSNSSVRNIVAGEKSAS